MIIWDTQSSTDVRQVAQLSRQISEGRRPKVKTELAMSLERLRLALEGRPKYGDCKCGSWGELKHGLLCQSCVDGR